MAGKAGHPGHAQCMKQQQQQGWAESQCVLGCMPHSCCVHAPLPDACLPLLDAYLASAGCMLATLWMQWLAVTQDMVQCQGQGWPKTECDVRLAVAGRQSPALAPVARDH